MIASTAPPTDEQRVGLWFAVVGSVCVVTGGLLAAAVANAPSEHAVWASAYLVLVAGVAQVAIGAAQRYLRARSSARPLVVAELVGWNVGNAAVIVGTVVENAAITDIGGALLVGVLALLFTGTRGARAGWWLRGYRLLLAVVLVSIPVGLVVGQITAS